MHCRQNALCVIANNDCKNVKDVVEINWQEDFANINRHILKTTILDYEWIQNKSDAGVLPALMKTFNGWRL